MQQASETPLVEHRQTIRQQVSWSFISLAIGPLLLLGIVLSVQAFIGQQNDALALQKQIALRLADQVTDFLKGLEGQLHLLVKTQDWANLTVEQQKAALERLLTYQDAFDELILLDEEGVQQAYVSRLTTMPEMEEWVDQDEFTVPRDGRIPYYGAVKFDSRSNEPQMTLSLPLTNLSSGQLTGVLIAKVRFRAVWNIISQVELEEGQSVYIVDAAHYVVAHRNPSVVLRQTAFFLPPADGVHVGLEGQNAVLAMQPLYLQQQTLVVVAEQGVMAALEDAIVSVVVILVLLLVTVVGAVSSALESVRRIVQPIESLSATVRALSAGDLQQRATLGDLGEIVELGSAFNSMAEQLQVSLENLEEQVYERTAALQAVALVAREAAGIRDVERLLEVTVHMISDYFKFYHAGIFLVDDAREYVVLRAASSEGGQRMLLRRHRLPVGRGMVGTVVARGEPRVALNVDADVTFVTNPDLPETRSEMALPLKVREQVIGVLDVQSERPDAFQDEDIAVVQMLADQIAMALDNAQLVQQVQERLEVERRAYGQLTYQAWLEILRTRTHLGQRYDPTGILKSQQQGLRPEMQQAMVSGALIRGVAQSSEDGVAHQTVTLPLKSRGERSVGVLDAYLPEGKQWTLTQISTLESLAEQLAVALESARLYEESRRRATREQLTREITDKMRRTLDWDDLMQVTVRQISEVWSASRVFIQWVDANAKKEGESHE